MDRAILCDHCYTEWFKWDQFGERKENIDIQQFYENVNQIQSLTSKKKKQN